MKFSVDWWNTLHQPASVSRLAAPAIHPDILVPLLVMSVAFTTLFFTLLILRIRTAFALRRVAAAEAVA